MKALFVLLSFWSLAYSIPSGADLKKCQQTSEDAQGKCEKIATAASTSSNGIATAAGAASEGAGANGMSGNNSTANTASGTGFDAANAECAKQKKRCEDDCNPAQEKDNQKKPKVAEEKKKCDEKIDSITKQLADASGANKDAQKKSEDTKDKSQGQGMQMPQMPQSDKKDDDKDTTPTSTGSTAAAIQSTGSAAAALPAALTPTGGTSTDCNSDEAYQAESCKDKLKTQCATSPNSGVCQAFTARFCGTSGSSDSSSTSSGTLSNGDQLKVGSGLSDDFCRGNNAKMFCQGANVDQCASCRALRGLSALPAGQVSQDCSLDPAGLPTPSANNAVVPQSTSSSGAAGFGGGGGDGDSLGSTTSTGSKDPAKATPDDPNAKLAASMGSGAAGGGGSGGGGGEGGPGSSSNDVSDFLSGYNVIGRNPAAAKAAADSGALALNPKITDVAPSDAPPLLRIQSLVIKARCDADKALNCPPHH